MPIYALNEHKHLIFAKKALKHKNYICLECLQTLRLRKGDYRQEHFFHLSPKQSCRQHGKGLTHLFIQSTIQKLLGTNCSSLEVPFPLIRRIADLVWHPYKLIFEIQCSPITAQEIQERNRDYQSIGYRVIWILHDKRFNQFRFSSAENALLPFPHYYTNLQANSNGIFYDQFSIYQRGLRFYSSKPVPINLAQFTTLKKMHSLKKQNLPKFVQQRLKTWGISFSGDILSTYFSLNYQERKIHKVMLEFEEIYSKKYNCPEHKKKPWQLIKSLAKKVFYRPYTCIFRMLLEKACKTILFTYFTHDCHLLKKLFGIIS